MKTRIIFIGAGYTSIWAYKQLITDENLKKIKQGELELVVICDRKHHYFHGFTGEVIGGVLPYDAINTPLRLLLKHARIMYGKVVAISPFLQTVRFYKLSEGKERELNYDYLVLGNGTEDNASLSGITDFGWSIKKPNGLKQMIAHIEKCIRDASLLKSQEERKASTTIAVIGAGFTGIEVATNLAERFNLKFKDVLSSEGLELKVYLLNRYDTLLHEWKNYTSLQNYVSKSLMKTGVQVMGNIDISEIKENGIELTSGIFIPTRTVIQATGQQVVAIKGLKHASMNDHQKLEVDEYLNLNGYTNIWCGGDTSLAKRPFTKTICPPNALWAIMQGTRIGKNIRRDLNGKSPRKFFFPGLGQAAAFGKGRGAMEMYGIPIWGWSAYVIRLGFFFYFFPAKSRLLKMWWQRTRNMNASDPDELSPPQVFTSKRRKLVLKQKRKLALA